MKREKHPARAFFLSIALFILWGSSLLCEVRQIARGPYLTYWKSPVRNEKFLATLLTQKGLDCQNTTLELTLLEAILSLYKRPITFLYVGQDREKITQHLASLFPGVFVLLDGARGELEAKYPSNYVHLSRPYDQETLQHLIESEHFDVAYIAENRIEWDKKGIRTLAQTAEHILVKRSSKEEELDELVKEKFVVLPFKGTSQDCFFFRFSKINHQKRTYWFEENSNHAGVREITSTYEKKFLKKKYGKRPSVSSWQPGINLMTFSMMEGDIPCVDTRRDKLLSLLEEKHPDLMPNNIIIQGANLRLIDFQDPNIGESEFRTVITEEFKQLMVLFIEEQDHKKIEAHYEQLLKYSRWACHR